MKERQLILEINIRPNQYKPIFIHIPLSKCIRSCDNDVPVCSLMFNGFASSTTFGMNKISAFTTSLLPCPFGFGV